MVEVLDRDELYRRVHPYQIKPGGQVSSSAFKDRRHKPLHRFSVDLAKLTSREACIARGGPGFRLIAFLASAVRAIGFRVWHEPEPDNYAHCNVEGENSNDICSQLASQSWLVDAA